jgi:hypothetical protein
LAFSWHGVKYARLNNNKGATVWMAAKNVAGEYLQVLINNSWTCFKSGDGIDI